MFSPFQGHPTTALNQLLRPTFLRNRNSTGAVAFPTTTTRKKKKANRFGWPCHARDVQCFRCPQDRSLQKQFPKRGSPPRPPLRPLVPSRLPSPCVLPWCRDLGPVSEPD